MIEIILKVINGKGGFQIYIFIIDFFFWGLSQRQCIIISQNET